MNSFKTVTSPKKTLKSCMITFAVMFALAFLGLTVTVAFWLFLEIIVVASSIVCFFIVKRTYWIIEFQDQTLFLQNHGTGQSYHIDELTLADFDFKQTEKQKASNTGHVRMEDYPLFMMYDVQNYSEFEAYVRRNFK